MDEREQFERNLECAREFFEHLLDEPVEQWPENGAAIVFLPANDPDVSHENLESTGSLPKGQPRFYASALGIVAPVSHDEPETPPSIGRAVG